MGTPDYEHNTRVLNGTASTVASFRVPPQPPAAATGLYIVNPFSLGDPVSVSWTASSGATSYNVWRKCKYQMYGMNCLQVQVISSTTSTSFTDVEVEIALNDGATDLFTYYVSAVNNVGESAKSDPAFTWGESFIKIRDDISNINEPIPAVYGLNANYPNPFNPSTIIKYSLPEASSVLITIYDIRGNEVKSWTNANEQPGYKQINWQAKDRNGHKVPAGIYIYKLTAISHETNEVFSKSMKMVLLK
ncbi:MAG: T9SS type A sorting domain-containing protein [Candidatus Marinimicrobia bacterium]|nr:T9SS type A sorting domain-containing protein [Candidatus Neomarinimicrobiota bacterium]MBL7009821.1 T9SS type A sorting domain-containing protein [Candidatus Neomarinimicrobiota bacterium]MBL7029940.1 T9SS type A sorting domain-containing protein [Candidatus Neomarinimicrobiota bacterium]